MNRVLTIMGWLSLTGCTSTSAQLSCDFITGASDNVLQRDVAKQQTTLHGKPVKAKGTTDITAGLVNVITGAVNRQLNNNTTKGCD